MLANEIRTLRIEPYDRLAELRSPVTKTVEGESGVKYQIEVQSYFDDSQKQTLRVTVAVDDKGWRSLKPISDDFIIASDGSFVGE